MGSTVMILRGRGGGNCGVVRVGGGFPCLDDFGVYARCNSMWELQVACCMICGVYLFVEVYVCIFDVGHEIFQVDN
jgi:hypothetical protein